MISQQENAGLHSTLSGRDKGHKNTGYLVPIQILQPLLEKQVDKLAAANQELKSRPTKAHFSSSETTAEW